MRILNLYAGIGGNRKLWEGHEVTAVELNPVTAEVYAHFYPQDTLIVGDAHQYLLDHYSEFDFIWASPPCPTHSRLNIALHQQGYIRYPEMELYQEILLLKQWGGRDGRKWVVENVRPYYKPLIQPRTEIERHLFWSNFYIPHHKIPSLGDNTMIKSSYRQLEKKLNIFLPPIKATDYERRLMLRDITRPEIGLHILNAALKETVQEEMFVLERSEHDNSLNTSAISDNKGEIEQ